MPSGSTGHYPAAPTVEFALDVGRLPGFGCHVHVDFDTSETAYNLGVGTRPPFIGCPACISVETSGAVAGAAVGAMTDRLARVHKRHHTHLAVGTESRFITRVTGTQSPQLSNVSTLDACPMRNSRLAKFTASLLKAPQRSMTAPAPSRPSWRPFKPTNIPELNWGREKSPSRFRLHQCLGQRTNIDIPAPTGTGHTYGLNVDTYASGIETDGHPVCRGKVLTTLLRSSPRCLFAHLNPRCECDVQTVDSHSDWSMECRHR